MRFTKIQSKACIFLEKIQQCLTQILNHAREALQILEHLVVQDIFLTETATYADVIFPASAWPEKNGTATNTNRQVQMGRKALDAPGAAKEDWWITNELGKRMGLDWSMNILEKFMKRCLKLCLH